MTAKPEPKPWTPNDRERLFIHEMIDPRARITEAAIRAGYSAKTAAQAGSRLFNDVKIRALIDAERKKFWEAKAMTREELVAEVSNIARFSMGRVLHVTKDGDPFIDLSKADPDDLAAIAEATIEDFTVGRGDDARDVRRVKIKPFSKLQAMDLMAKVSGWLKDGEVKVDVTIDFASAMAEAERRVAKAREQQ
jgi:phage terminase small subunit